MSSNDPIDAYSDNRLQPPDVTAVPLTDDGTYPNNPDLPLVIYQAAFVPDRCTPATVEAVFRQNRWGGTWRNGIYAYHHYHSTAHEVLGVTRGSARVRLGGPEGETFEVEAGDVLILPAGVAHKNVGASDDFLVVGAYPEGQDWDMNTGRSGERPQADQNIKQVPLPAMDPVYGANGPLCTHWM
jgi:uncharacterized protein YjlB